MFMFWSKRTILTRRLLKAKIHREYETECETQGTTSGQIKLPTDTSGQLNDTSSNRVVVEPAGSDCGGRRELTRDIADRSVVNRLHQACCGGVEEDNEDLVDGRLSRCKELLKGLKENQLEMLVMSVESCGADLAGCVLVRRINSCRDEQLDHYRRHRHVSRSARHHHPLRHRHSDTRQRSKCRHCEMKHVNSGVGEDDDEGDDVAVVNVVNVVNEPANLLACQMWRWPDLAQSKDLKKLPVCHSAMDSSYVCCNPYHWSRLCKPESPPPPYCLIPAERVAKQEGAVQSSQMEARGNAAEPSRLPDSLTTDGEEHNEDKKEWCTLAYWELGGRVGRLYPVEASTISVFDSLHDGDGLCLASLAQNHGSSAAVRRTRQKIGLGLMLSQESDGVWAYNRSDTPIFVNSPTLDDPESRTLLVYRVPPGFCLNIFDRSKRPNVRLSYGDSLNSTGPVDANSVRISFAKGWGPKYSRQEVTSCPCWLEVLLAPCR
ncbi:mothers against decapentaplegic homolog 6 [Diachasmimorpha longicaudata]|uniref:mothers against decapentaplegic homolog 6 n=1 Tax=Diachasmimorpha longicaudata TaxID=58733 RepID=UPI0030B87F05